MAGTRKNQNVRGKEMKRRVLEEINADDALAVLNILAERDADASRKIEEIAVEYLSEVDIEDLEDLQTRMIQFYESREQGGPPGPRGPSRLRFRPCKGRARRVAG
ncbi:MAG: hypothetical protein KKF66_07210 [Actinobacteria bacterium]|nr:hypothetical protein [Actinomycetota bacterium]